jgi:hypothetical protein
VSCGHRYWYGIPSSDGEPLLQPTLTYFGHLENLEEEFPGSRIIFDEDVQRPSDSGLGAGFVGLLRKLSL